MIISFYEEYPTRQNLEKIDLIKFPTKLYVAARSLREFERIKKRIETNYANENIKEIAYWPVLSKKEGYWFSAFTQRNALKRVINELKGKNIPVMWDAELPTHPNPFLYITQLPNFFSNRKLIRDFVKNHRKIYVAEYFFVANTLESLFKFLAISFPPKFNTYPMRMAYSSMHDFGSYIMDREVRKGKEMFGNRFIMAYGTLTSGILGWEKPIDIKLLKRDLDLAKKYRLKEIVLFRLGGLNQKYIKLLEKYV